MNSCFITAVNNIQFYPLLFYSLFLLNRIRSFLLSQGVPRVTHFANIWNRVLIYIVHWNHLNSLFDYIFSHNHNCHHLYIKFLYLENCYISTLDSPKNLLFLS